MSEITDDPKMVADQLGHTVDVNQNVYTRRFRRKAQRGRGRVRILASGDGK